MTKSTKLFIWSGATWLLLKFLCAPALLGENTTYELKKGKQFLVDGVNDYAIELRHGVSWGPLGAAGCFVGWPGARPCSWCLAAGSDPNFPQTPKQGPPPGHRPRSPSANREA